MTLKLTSEWLEPATKTAGAEYRVICKNHINTSEAALFTKGAPEMLKALWLPFPFRRPSMSEKTNTCA